MTNIHCWQREFYNSTSHTKLYIYIHVSYADKLQQFAKKVTLSIKKFPKGKLKLQRFLYESGEAFFSPWKTYFRRRGNSFSRNLHRNWPSSLYPQTSLTGPHVTLVTLTPLKGDNRLLYS